MPGRSADTGASWSTAHLSVWTDRASAKKGLSQTVSSRPAAVRLHLPLGGGALLLVPAVPAAGWSPVRAMFAPVSQVL